MLSVAAVLAHCAAVQLAEPRAAIAAAGLRARAASPSSLPRARRAGAPAMLSKEDAESNARLVSALFESVDSASKALEKSKDVPSHMQLDRDEDGNPIQLRFAYVDEYTCIGCTYCASIARNTFFMHDDAGRARVFAQGQDSPDLIMEAMDSCPVTCISYVDYEDLVILETERDQQSINPTSIGLPSDWSVSTSRLPPTKAKMGGSGSLTCCNFCPSRGCKECPMYGVGQNPIYLKRLEERERKRMESGETARDAADADAAAKVRSIFEEPIDITFDDPVGVVKPVSPYAPVKDTPEENATGTELSTDFFATLYNIEEDE